MDELEVADVGGKPEDEFVEEEDDAGVAERLGVLADGCQPTVEVDVPAPARCRAPLWGSRASG